MTSPDHDETIFHAARARPAVERAAFLDAACAGDPTLRSRIDALLQADAAAGDFLLGRRAPPTTPPGEHVGDAIDRYRLLRLVGEGGFGTVWMAEQTEPVRRNVALKVLKPGMDTVQVVARFEQERQALAMMDHPNIATVFDGGATAMGRPYFVMEFVEGAPIVEFCDRVGLTIEERLGLFAQVCSAVQHAHGKGIIHRDLKPSNVLVGTRGGRPHAKVIDFGIAKATSPSLRERTRLTEQQQVVGTLSYMSPEQAEGSADIDTRSDVYSLGALLYELLVGEPPFPDAQLLDAGMLEVQRILREVEPRKPSTRISESHAALASIAAHRRVEPRRLQVLVRGDLDWIVMKALEKDRSRRYETVDGLWLDVQRHLAGEPVVAAPPSAVYRLRKFVRRNRAAVAAGMAVAAALLLGIAGTSYGLVRALDEKTRADGKAAAEAKARARAETITKFVVTALDSGDPRERGSQGATILLAMENAIRDIATGRFADDPETEARLQGIIGLVLQNNGRPEEAEPLLENALATWQRLRTGDDADVARALNDLALAVESQGRASEAEPMVASALAMTRRLNGGADDVNVARDLGNLGHLYERLGRHRDAEAHYVEALAMTRRMFHGDHQDTARMMNGLGVLRYAMGRSAEAEPLLVQALEMNRRISPGDHPDVALALNNLAIVRQSLGRTAEAETLFVDALAMYERLFAGDHSEVANGLNNVAHVRQALGRLPEAESALERALAMYQRLFPGDHPATANVMNNLAGVRKALGRPAECEQLYVQALDMTRRLFPGDHPDVEKCLNNLGHLRLSSGRTSEAEPLLVEALDMSRRLFADGHPNFAGVLNNVAALRQSQGRLPEAAALFAEAIAMLRRLDPQGSRMLARVLWRSGCTRLEGGDAASALPELEEAAAMAGKHVAPGSPELAEYAAALAKCRAALGK